MNRLDILRDAREIAITQGAVTEGVHYWEDRRTGEERAQGTWGSGPLVDPGDCRVCAAGAIMLAELRAGLTPNQKIAYVPVMRMADDRFGEGWMRRMQDNTEFLVQMIDVLIEEEVARQQEFAVESVEELEHVG